MWKNLFYFTRREKSGLIFLMLFITTLFVGKHFFSKSRNELPKISELQTASEVLPQKDSLLGERTYSSSFNSSQNHKQTNYKKKPSSNVEKRTYFNNRSLGTAYVKDTAKNNYRSVEKYPEGTKIDVNSADTTDLMKVPGIGHAYATRILKYRKLLGGYYSVEQLKEVYGMYEELYVKFIPFLDVSSDSIVLIFVNKASLDRLKSHPYMNFYQAKAILELRKKRGNIRSLDELSLLEEFTTIDLEKLKNYLSFD